MPKNPDFHRFFKDFKPDSTIFDNYDYLAPSHQPQNLINREKQIEKIWKELTYALIRNSIPQNFFLYGLPGTGKTCTIKYPLQKVIQWSEVQDLQCPILFYNNCAIYNTPFRILRELCRCLGTEIPRTGISTDDAFSRFLGAINRYKQLHLIIILDELDLFFKNKVAANEFFYKLIRFPSADKTSIQISLIGITNDLLLKDSFDSRIMSSLSPIEIYFPPYSALELQEILYQRANAFKPDVLDFGVIEFIAAYLAQKDGDARKLINILRTAGELADKAQDPKVLETHARLAIKKFAEVQKTEIIASLPIQSKKILQAIQNMQKKQSNSITGNVYNEYVRLCQDNHPILSLRHFNNHIKKLEKLNLINTERLYRGKRGNTRKISFYFS
ncbi:MAG: AAA family ATPase [Candidatus Helarchaeota archaeon]|nr:AAA family ATPase [Candidatus Helarchaeota archaeon]